ncbi:MULTISPECIES: diaminopimelate epimerase [Persicobacter]|uniref:Diaminopimelate epimerase n=1 Tax=Persicobacter diffluens TaxID=981 RepID=A0AAN5AK28_9BACT|nr:diaminopimelate epimerase [Persicobacter sp. CCB-QB2]GJM62350.1 diaminopimelate epimerase [Persicobacter diffluens]
MDSLAFYKYQGTGNDFVMIDNREMVFDPENIALVQRLCDRRFGIGGDGLILIQHKEGYDFEMVYFNSDGTKSLCGNGSRCGVRFAEFLGLVKEETYFLTIEGGLHAKITPELIHLKMPNVKGAEQIGRDYFINTGSPHYVRFVEDVENLKVYQEGQAVRYNERFKAEGTNVNFVQRLGEQDIFVRTYERGVEDETLSCGTGVTACALASHIEGMPSPVNIKVMGGNLKVSFEQVGPNEFENIFLIGPAEQVFEGTIKL